MTHPLELAKQLGIAIMESTEYHSFQKSRLIMEASENALQLIETFQSNQQALTEYQHAGIMVTEEQMEELRENQRKMLESPEISAYLEARKDVDALLAAVNETIAQITGMETGSGGCGGGSCSGCC